jgi:hypothetical protein
MDCRVKPGNDGDCYGLTAGASLGMPRARHIR